MLGLTQAELAKSAGISTTGLNNIERNSADPKASTLRAIQTALEEGGIIFMNDGELVRGGPGIRLKSQREEFEPVGLGVDIERCNDQPGLAGGKPNGKAAE